MPFIIAAVSASYAFSPFDSDTEVQAPIREGEKPVIPYDAVKYAFGHLITHGMPVYRLIEGGLVPGKNFIQMGLTDKHYLSPLSTDHGQKNE